MTIQEFYKAIDNLVESLNEKGHKDLSKKLYDAKSFNFSSSEILGELEIILKEIKSITKDCSENADMLLEWIHEAFRSVGDRSESP